MRVKGTYDPPLMYMSWANPILEAIRSERDTATQDDPRSIYVRWSREIDRLLLHENIPPITLSQLRHARQVLARLIGVS